VGIGVGLGLVVIGRIGRIGAIAVLPGPESRDMEEIHQPLMILLGGELYGRELIGRASREDS